MIDWVRLLSDNQIPFVTAGPNVSKGNIGFKCPFCGENDPSFHGGVNLITGKWSCWRDTTHRGNQPFRLISALLGISGPQARLVMQAYSGANLDEFDALAGVITAPAGIQKPVVMPPEFQPIKAYSLTHKFWVYIYKRGFDNPDQVIEDYNLQCCLTGRWKGRLIIPVYGARSSVGLEHLTFNQGVAGSNPAEPTLIGWQGRSIRTVEGTPRYLTSAPAVKRTLLNLQNLGGGDRLYICEGPFDGIKIDYYGKPLIRATCTFSAEFTIEQVEILYKLTSKFSQLILLFDNDSVGVSEGFKLSDWLPMAQFGSLPEGHKDTDKLSAQQMKRWLHG